MKITNYWRALFALITLVIMIGSLDPRICSAQSKTSSASKAVKVGVYMTDILNINFPENEITVEFYMWFAYTPKPDGSIEPHKTVRIVNATEVEIVPLGIRGSSSAGGGGKPPGARSGCAQEELDSGRLSFRRPHHSYVR